MRADVTELNRRGDELAERETLLRHGSAMARLGCWVWDEAADRCLYCTETLAEIHELTVEQYLERLTSLPAVLRHIHPDDRERYQAVHVDAAANGRVTVLEVRIITSSGAVRHIREKAEYVLDPQGRPFRSLGIVQDITEQKLRENELERARAAAEDTSRAKSEFLAHMSHELRTPLNAVIGFSELIQPQLHGPLGSDRYLGYLDDIQASARHLLGLINDLLDLSKIEAGRFELDEHPMELSHVLERSVKLLKDQAGRKALDLVVRPEAMPAFVGDERAIQQVLVNLISSAVKFTPERGRVEAEAEARLVDGDPTFLVRDTGVGIPPEELPLVFESFAQASHTQRSAQTGTGLGLPIVRSLVRLHGGSVEIESAPGQGTTVTVRLPSARLLSAVA